MHAAIERLVQRNRFLGRVPAYLGMAAEAALACSDRVRAHPSQHRPLAFERAGTQEERWSQPRKAAARAGGGPDSGKATGSRSGADADCARSGTRGKAALLSPFRRRRPCWPKWPWPDLGRGGEASGMRWHWF